MVDFLPLNIYKSSCFMYLRCLYSKNDFEYKIKFRILYLSLIGNTESFSVN